jgi:hypothetical protein
MEYVALALMVFCCYLFVLYRRASDASAGHAAAAAFYRRKLTEVCDERGRLASNGHFRRHQYDPGPPS